MTSNVRGKYQTPGEFRRSPNWIGPTGVDLNTAPYVPPPVQEMKDALSEFEKYLHTTPALPPLIRLGLIHYQFEAIHPFLDGNGRIGRLLNVLLLCEWKLLPAPLLYLSGYIEAHRQRYYDLLLKVSQEGEWEAWLVFFLNGIESQALDALTRAARLQSLREQYRDLIQASQSRAAAGLLQLVDLLFQLPIVTARQVENLLSIDYQAANRYIKQLIDFGLLREMTGKTRNRIFIASAIIHAIDDALDEP